jgi:serine/threonine protein kinase
MGVVHLGIHEETGAERAIKTLQTNDPELSLRFQREAEAMARLDGHPNIVRVHAFGQEGNTKYLVMDLARGGSLGDRLTKGPLKPGEAATLVRDLAQGLAQAHAAGILHRDLKPDNVLFGEDGTPKLTDFGLAKLADATSLTETGTIMGTPAYMSPEQADASKAVDARSDVYGLGAILYHALAGVPPFKGPSAMVILARVFKDSPQPPSAFSPVPAGLDRLCLQTLAKDPRERPHSATALDHALGTWLDTKASSRPLSSWG